MPDDQTYAKTAWVDESTPDIDALNLNKIEDGIYDAHDRLNKTINRGTKAAIPAAAAVGAQALYWATDEKVLYESDGAAWSAVTLQRAVAYGHFSDTENQNPSIGGTGWYPCLAPWSGLVTVAGPAPSSADFGVYSTIRPPVPGYYVVRASVKWDGGYTALRILRLADQTPTFVEDIGVAPASGGWGEVASRPTFFDGVNDCFNVDAFLNGAQEHLYGGESFWSYERVAD